MTIWRFAGDLAEVPEDARITLGEGNTPLVRSRSIGPRAGLQQLYFKLELTNPSGSYKDRFAAVAIADMRARGLTQCIATSSGNTGAALAAYCAAAQIPCRIAIVESAPRGKLLQMSAYGAQLVRVRGFGTDATVTDQVFGQLQEFAAAPHAALQISGFRYSPSGMTGVRSISYELCEQLPGVAHVFCPAGGGGLVLGVAQGFARGRPGQPTAATRVHCVQPAGNDTISGPLREGSTRARAVACTTHISGLQVASVVDGDAAIAACRASGGTGYLVEDQEVWSIQARLAREEGIFCEPAAAVAVAGALHALRLGELDADSLIVCLVTGSGFKDSPSLERMAGAETPCIDLHELPAWITS